ncbi:hypothetical protein MDAP_001127 [Mitosporidium daphniae]|uniref:Anion:cation symporter MFS transporter n=1 Tax=Mitosporidium daphniae TaxID=1485682 RepID=A0A098VTI9_9MICR|nr:anion:cation symporter MFS transporter [Mitosporidium daphniae]KGG52378.1 anion:cation symporter MFS transporter [Mitosporidium daphniae]|eukprot:XP_013238836.1 anion:cation symporter MFS transporter [Mitosporidium daphniae]
MRKTTRAFLIVLHGFLGLTLAYSIRIILSPAIMRLTKMHGWDEGLQGILLSAFYWGYMVLQVPGGYLSHRFGAKWVMVLSLLGSALLNSVIPILGSSLELSFLVRFACGLLQGMYWVSTLNIISTWVSKAQMSLAVSFALAGQHFGSALIQGLYAPIASAFQWYTPFHLLTGLTILWTISWTFFGKSRLSESDKREEAMSSIDSERSSIAQSDAPGQDLTFKETLSYKEVWAFVIVLFCYNWSFYFLVSYLVKFLHLHLGFSETTSGLYSFSAYGLLCLSLTASGKFTSAVIASGKMNVTKVRKYGVAIGIIPSAVLIFLIPVLYNYVSASALAAILVAAIAISGIAHGSFMTNPVDLNPINPGVIGGLGNTIATIPGIIVPIINGAILNSGGCSTDPISLQCWNAWRILFIVSGSLYVVGLAVWLAFSSGKPLNQESKRVSKLIPY